MQLHFLDQRRDVAIVQTAACESYTRLVSTVGSSAVRVSLGEYTGSYFNPITKNIDKETFVTVLIT